MKTGCSLTENENLSLFFEPDSVAVVGSLKEGFFGGYVVIKSLLEAGYGGAIYPINPNYKEVLGLKSFPSLRALGRPVDLLILIINAKGVCDMIREAGELGIKAAVVVSDGFAERDREGAKLQAELTALARELGVRIVGPNTAGVLSTWEGFNPCPYDAGYYRIKKGTVAIFSQSGMTNPQAFPYPASRLGLSRICDLGNKCDVDECDLLDYLERDPRTSVISAYLEGVADGRRFLHTASRVAIKKPVLLLKSGRTQEGARASASHTGSMAVDDRVFDSVCSQAGILRVDEFADLFDLPKVFSLQPRITGNRFAAVSYTGGIGVMAIDRGAAFGLVPARLSDKTAEFLEGFFPGLGTNPVDIGPMAVSIKNFREVFPAIEEAVASDPNVDCLLNVLWCDIRGESAKAYLDGYSRIKGRHQKPVVTWTYGPNPEAVSSVAQAIEDMGFPVFSTADRAMKALGLAWRYELFRRGSGA
jgi:acetyltransferase